MPGFSFSLTLGPLASRENIQNTTHPLYRQKLLTSSRIYWPRPALLAQLCVSSAQWGHANWNVRVWNRERFIVGYGKQWLAYALESPELPEGFWQSIFTSQMGWSQDMWSVHAQFSGWVMVHEQDGRSLGSRRPGAVSQVKQLTSFIWWGIFTSAKQLRKCASNTVIWVFQRGAAAEDGPVVSCLVTASPGPGSWRDWKSGDQCSWEAHFLVLCPRPCSLHLLTQCQLPC